MFDGSVEGMVKPRRVRHEDSLWTYPAVGALRVRVPPSDVDRVLCMVVGPVMLHRAVDDRFFDLVVFKGDGVGGCSEDAYTAVRRLWWMMGGSAEGNRGSKVRERKVYAPPATRRRSGPFQELPPGTPRAGRNIANSRGSGD